MEQGLAVETRNVYEDEYFSIQIRAEEKLLFYKIIGYPKSSDMIRQGHDGLYKIAREMQRDREIVNLVADLTEAKILLNRDILFIGSISYPRLAKTGIRNLAILLKDDFHVKINVQKTIACLGPNVFQRVKLCASLDEANEWFRGLPE